MTFQISVERAPTALRRRVAVSTRTNVDGVEDARRSAWCEVVDDERLVGEAIGALVLLLAKGIPGPGDLAELTSPSVVYDMAVAGFTRL